MNVSESLISKKEKLAIIGLGYVGLPLALSFAKHVDVIGFDINEDKINEYRRCVDSSKEIDNAELCETACFFTCDDKDLAKAKFFIIAVPTPIDENNQPDLSCLINASLLIGKYLSKGSIIIYESTVYPGTTQEVCIPKLEETSGLKCPVDFKVGYSPERINPGDKSRKIKEIVKIVSGIDGESLHQIGLLYEIIISAGIHYADSIMIAEAAKVAENSQRDVNIAFMNELAISLNSMGLKTQSVIDAMNTKWNALCFTPGLVGGHCISVDPYYLIHQSKKSGIYPELLLASRRINESFPKFIVKKIIELLDINNIDICKARIAMMGITYKENCADLRNSKSIVMAKELELYGIDVTVFDPVADKEELERAYKIRLCNEYDEIYSMNIVVFSVAHDEFFRLEIQKEKLKNKTIIVDIKNQYGYLADYEHDGIQYWSL